MPERALVVLSGGQDSTTCLFWAVKEYGAENVGAVTFDYNQRHRREIDAAWNVGVLAGINSRHEIVDIGDILAGTSPLTDKTQELETYKDFESMSAVIGDRVEKTFVPMRNALFLTLAANRAEVGGYNHIVTGVCEEDNANYPDCRESFIHSQEGTMNEALGHTPFLDGGWICIDTPLMHLSKAATIALSIECGGYPALAFSHTAYDGVYPPTSKDHASVLRAHGFEEAGMPDPLVIRAWLGGLMGLPETLNYSVTKVAEAKKELCQYFTARGFVDWVPSI